jgi:hypothetical protein
MGWILAAAAVVLVGGTGAGVSAQAADIRPAGATVVLPAGLPRYYIEDGIKKPRSGQTETLVRRTATGAVTATIRCPRLPAGEEISNIAAADHHAFFLACDRVLQRGANSVVTGSRIYRFLITAAGRVSSYSLVRGAVLDGLRTGSLAATPDGSQIAVTVAPGASSAEIAKIMVINTRTAEHVVWQNRPAVPGTIRFNVGDLSFARHGHELAFLTQPRCVHAAGAPPCKVDGGEEVRALNPAAGGLLGSSRVLLRQSKIMRLSKGYINDAVVSPGGSALTLAIVGVGASSNSSGVSVVRYSAATDKRLRILYRIPTGNGFFYRFFSADPSGRYLLLDAGPISGAVNGWIDHGRLVRLKPAGDNVFFEVW